MPIPAYHGPMATLVSEARTELMGDLRYQPTEKRVRAALGGYTVADSTHAVLVWEPRRILPSYAFPEQDLRLRLSPASVDPPEDDPAVAPVLHGAHPFWIHSTDGEALDISVGDAAKPGAAFRAADPDLSGYVVLDFHAFDYWYEEDEPIVAHPRDPFHRVDTRLSSRHVQIEADGILIADTSRAQLVFETSLPVRFYIPREDVKVDLKPTDKITYCAYKGRASYWSFEAGGRPYANLAWSYAEPLSGADALTDLICFFDEKLDVSVEGPRRTRQRDSIASTILEESGV
jgi:uncharacterized protein (DUF427 family)